MKHKSSFPAALSVLIASSVLSGCLLTSPYKGQKFDNRNDAIPIQAWSTNSGDDILIECATATHAGPAPFFGTPEWITVSTISATVNAAFDPSGGKIYGAGTEAVLPSACWYMDLYDNRWRTAIRAKHDSGGSWFLTFDNAGLGCLGEAIGLAALWSKGLTSGCEQTYDGTDTAIRHVIVSASG